MGIEYTEHYLDPDYMKEMVEESERTGKPVMWKKGEGMVKWDGRRNPDFHTELTDVLNEDGEWETKWLVRSDRNTKVEK